MKHYVLSQVKTLDLPWFTDLPAMRSFAAHQQKTRKRQVLIALL